MDCYNVSVQAAALETALIEALQRLEAHGISVPPAQVKQRQAQHGTRDGGASSADMGLELLSFLLELGESQQLASQLDLVLEVVQLLRLDGNPDTLAKVRNERCTMHACTKLQAGLVHVYMCWHITSSCACLSTRRPS